MLQLTYIYHDCFVVVADGVGSLIFDYWKDPDSEGETFPKMLRLIPKDLPCFVVVSHHHKDHFNRDIFEWSREFPLMRYVVSKDVAKMVRHMLRPESIWKGTRVAPEKVSILQPGDKCEIGKFQFEAFGSTDIGNSYLVTIEGSTRIFHAGDLNAWIWKDESTEAEVQAAIRNYWDKLNPLVRRLNEYVPAQQIDFALFPVDSRIGREYWTGAKIFLEALPGTKRFIPMHFGLGETLEQSEKFAEDARTFTEYCNRAADSMTELIALQRRGDTVCVKI